MRTTLVIPDAVYRALKRRAAERGETISALATEFLRRGLAGEGEVAEPPPLPTFEAGVPRVDVADREALFEALDGGTRSGTSSVEGGGGSVEDTRGQGAAGAGSRPAGGDDASGSPGDDPSRGSGS